VPLFVFLWFVNGLMQSPSWPAMISVLSFWFPHRVRGTVMGVWSACGSTGNIFGAQISNLVLYVFGLNWRWCLIFTAGFVAVVGVVDYFVLVVHPEEVGLVMEEEEETAGPGENLEGESDALLGDGEGERGVRKEKGISFGEALRIEGVVVYALALGALGFVDYGMLFWLPRFMESNYGVSQSLTNNLASMFDVGQIVGGILAGWFSDRLGKRSPIIVLMLIMAQLLTLTLFLDMTHFGILYFAIPVLGMSIGGPYNIMCAAISSDLLKSSRIRGNTAALSIITGIIAATGGMGAALGQTLIGYIQQFGWRYLFLAFLIVLTLCELALAKMVGKDIRSLKQQRNATVAQV